VKIVSNRDGKQEQIGPHKMSVCFESLKKKRLDETVRKLSCFV